MNEQTKLILALHQVDNLIKLFEGNRYEKFLCALLTSIKVEIKRQIVLVNDGKEVV